MKNAIFILLVLTAQFVYAEKHIEHSAMGIHGMALMTVESGFIASHMPLHDSMHAHQVVFTVEVDNPTREILNQLFNDNNLISLRPEPFDLNRLMEGRLPSFKADIVAGHFERGGSTQIDMASFSVKRMLLAEPIEDKNNGSFYQVDYSRQHSLLIHQIGKVPSFDQIVLVENKSIDKTNRNVAEKQMISSKVAHALDKKNSADILAKNKLNYVKSLYLETKDFQVR